MLLSVVSHTFGQELAFVLQEQGPPMVQALLQLSLLGAPRTEKQHS